MAEAAGMSVGPVSAADREREALRRAQKAHEPSMEEILASIRTIIAEDREPAKPSEAKEPAAKPAAPAPQPQIVYSKSEAPDAPSATDPPPRQEPSADSHAPKVVWRQPQAEPTATAPAPRADEDRDAPLIAPETGKAVAASFEALGARLAARSAERAEAMAREMLRPMLKAWLDENLPSMVERLVRAEIERIVNGDR